DVCSCVLDLNFWLFVLLCFCVFLMHGTASAHENPPQGTGAQITAGQIEQRGWSDEDITGAWEAISHIYISLPGKDNAPREIIEEIEQTNELLKEKRLVERF